MTKNLFIRVDSSNEIGSGHVIRCLALAHALKHSNVEIFFVCRKLAGHFCDYIGEKGHNVFELPNGTTDFQTDARETIEIIERFSKPIDWLIVDHYNLDAKWESSVRNHVKQIIVIDDLADRLHDCDLIVDQNLYNNMEKRYAKLVSDKCIKLLGPRYALLRPEFKKAKESLRQRDGSLDRILISFGTTDPTNETLKALEAISQMNIKQLRVDVVVGMSNENKDAIRSICMKNSDTIYHHQTDNIAELMAKADLSIGSGGTTTWERCCVGLPAVVSISAKNQLELTEKVAKEGCVINLGWAQELTSKDYLKAIKNLNSQTLCRMSQKCLELVDGEGASRVADAICSL